MRQTIRRFLSPRRLIASVLTLSFLAWYLFLGFAVLAARQPADPAKVQLWLSGGMVLYAVYHAVKCAWAGDPEEIEQTPAEGLWLSGGPLTRASIAVYRVGDQVLPTFLKSLLLSVVLLVDVRFPVLLVVGVFSAFLSLEVIRLAVSRVASSMGPIGRTRLRWITTLFAIAVVTQVIARIFAAVPWGAPIANYLIESLKALGRTAASDAIQWLSIPWVCGSQVAVAQQIDLTLALNFAGCMAMFPCSILGYVLVDQWCNQAVHRREVRLWKSGVGSSSNRRLGKLTNPRTRWHRFASASSMATSLRWIDIDAAAIASRVATSVSKYRVTLWFSFLIPTALCLSPLISPQVNSPWFFVVGGLATCTLLLAPASVRLDFRRDFKRLELLKSLPISPRSMVLGQLYFPVVVTWMFQGFVLFVAALVLRPGFTSVSLWTGMLMALAVFVFAMENSIFLAYPHSQHDQGMMMMIRSKLAFLGKMTLAALALVALGTWAVFCKSVFPDALVPSAVVAGALIATWSIAWGSVAIMTSLWRRWNPSLMTN